MSVKDYNGAPITRTNNPMDSYLMVACEIYKYNTDGTPVNYTGLVKSLSDVMDEITVSSALDTLSDWFIIDGEYGCLGNGRTGYLYYIHNHERNMVKQLYDKYWNGVV